MPSFYRRFPARDLRQGDRLLITCVANGLAHVRFHDPRHTFLQRLEDAGPAT